MLIKLGSSSTPFFARVNASLKTSTLSTQFSTGECIHSRAYNVLFVPLPIAQMTPFRWHACINAASAGKMLARALFDPVITKDATKVVQVEWTITATSS